MQITKINNINFTRKPILICNLKNNVYDTDVQGVVFELETKNTKDEKEAYYLPFHKEFLKERDAAAQDYATSGQNRRFYILKDAVNKETIAYAQTSHRYKNSDENFFGSSTIIEEFGSNDDYNNAFESILAAIAIQAKTNLDSSLCLAIRQEEIPDSQNIKFETNYKQEQFIDKTDFDNIVSGARENAGVCFFA